MREQQHMENQRNISYTARDCLAITGLAVTGLLLAQNQIQLGAVRVAHQMLLVIRQLLQKCY